MNGRSCAGPVTVCLVAQSLHSPREQRDAVVLLGAAGRAGAAGLERFGDGLELGGCGVPLGFALVFAVEVGDPPLSAVSPQDLGSDVLAAGTQAFGAELPDGEQAGWCPVVGVGGQSVSLPVRVVVGGEDALALRLSR